MSHAPAAATGARCYLLELPAELRNEIYELAFTSDDDPQETNLLAMHLPTAPLLLTCSQIYDEAAALFKACWVAYWPARNFVIKDCDRFITQISDRPKRLNVNISLPSDSVLACVTHLEISSDTMTYPGFLHKITVNDGIWSSYDSPSTEYHFAFVAEGHCLWDDDQQILTVEGLGGTDLDGGIDEGDRWNYVHLEDLDEEQIRIVKEASLRKHLTEYEVIGALRWLPECWD